MTERRLPQTAVENLVEDLASKANADLSNLDATGQAKFDAKANIALTNSPYTTNRILEIPQDIKLELNNGTLTLKAGSKVYVPNGAGVFDTLTINSDKTLTVSDNAVQLVCINSSNKNMIARRLENCVSGADAAITAGFAYNTTTNQVRFFDGTGTDQGTNYSLPVAIITILNGAISSIDQVFNGFGYIGSTVFVLPGVKVQTPNGRNEDGTYKSVIRTLDSVRTFDAGVWGTRNLNIQFSGSLYALIFEGQAVERFTYNKKFSSDGITYSYDESTGIWWFSSDQSNWISFPNNIVGSCRVENGKITQFQVDTVDSVVNSNASNFSQAGRSYLSGLGMPSNRYIDLTLGASGSTYTAPANGWFVIGRQAGANNAYIDMFNSTKAFRKQENIPISSVYGFCFIPCSKNDIIMVNYNASGTLSYFKFIYAEGENNV